MGEDYAGDIGDIILQMQAPAVKAAQAGAQAAMAPVQFAQQDLGQAAVLPPPPPPIANDGGPPAQDQQLQAKAPLIPFPPEAVDDENWSPALAPAVQPPAFPKWMPKPPPPQPFDPVVPQLQVASPMAKAAAAAKSAAVGGAIPVFQGPIRNAPLPPPPTPAEAQALYPQVAKAKNPNALHHGTLSWATVLNDMLAMKESGDVRGSSVKLMKSQYLLRYVQLMRKLGLSTKRQNVARKSIELLFKSFFLCGDFARSKVQYFSWVKNYITRKCNLSADAAAAYSRWFAVLHRNKIPQAQEQGLRLTHMVRICHAVRHSVDSVILVTKRRRASTGQPAQFTAGQLVRHLISCWFAFLRPDEAGRTTRKVKTVGGHRCVTYCIAYRKNRPRSHFNVDFKCMCSYAVYLQIPICPVCCIDEETWRLIGTYVDSELWARAIRQLVYAAAIPNPVINGRWSINAHSPLQDQWERSRILTDLQGQGLADEAQRNHLNAQNDLLDEGCSDSAYLIVSRSLENRDIKKTWSPTAFSQVKWNPLTFVAALHAAGALRTVEARALQRHVKNAITGSVTCDDRPGMDRETVFNTFWTTVKEILSSDYMPVLVANPAGAGGAPAAETPVELYTRRVRTAFRTNFNPTFDGHLKWVTREKKLKDAQDERLALVEAARVSDRADFQNRLNQMKNNRNNNGGKNNNNNNANKTPGANGATTDGAGNGKNKQRDSVLDAYNDPENPNRERSPRRANPKEKLVCEDYASGKTNCPCAGVAKGGSCPKGRHGGSFRRIQYLNVKNSYGLSHAEVRDKATESLPPMQPSNADANFSLEITRDYQRSYGAGSVLPQCVRFSIDIQKAHNSDQLKAKNKKVAQRLISLHESLKAAEAAEHAAFPKHMQHVYKDKSLLFLEKLTSEAVDLCGELRPRKSEADGMIEQGLWELIPESDWGATSSAATPALRQYRSDIAADFEAEKSLRLHTREAIEKQIQVELQRDIAYGTSTILSDQQLGSLAAPLADERFAFVPLGGKKDMSSYYYQYAVDSPKRNTLWIPGARTGRRDASGNARRQWRLVASSVALFGVVRIDLHF
eukprot:g18182.t1